MLEEVKKQVYELLGKDNSGHGIEHVNRVLALSLKFAKQEKANVEIVGLTALLHDVDDYKIFGKENAENLTNARNIMKKLNIDFEIQKSILDIIKSMGYSKLLNGIRPISLEGKIVSDADMCDAIGSNGIIRSIVYDTSSKGSGTIFDRNIYPNINITQAEYNSKGTTHSTDNAINYFFEKLLKLSDLMLTESGKEESIERQKIMIEFLRHFFEEENANEWIEFLNMYLENQKAIERKFEK